MPSGVNSIAVYGGRDHTIVGGRKLFVIKLLPSFEFDNMPLTDEQQLVEFGFPRDRVQYALRVTNNNGLQQAMDW